MADSKDEPPWFINTEFLTVLSNYGSLFNFDGISDIEVILDKLRHDTYILSCASEVPKDKKQELQDITGKAAEAFEEGNFGNLSKLLFQSGMLLERYVSQAQNVKIRSDSVLEKAAPFICFVVNRARAIAKNDVDNQIPIDHMVKLLVVEVNTIRKDIIPLLKGNSELEWVKGYQRITYEKVKKWLRTYALIPGYALKGGSPGKEKNAKHDERIRIAQSHEYRLTIGKGEIFTDGKERSYYHFPVDCEPPIYE